jgi:hypothetical protein
MKIGLSLSRCVRDIVKKKVHIDDVLVIISRTNFDPTIKEEWDEIWDGYNGVYGGGFTHPEWIGLKKAKVHDVVLDLWKRGLIHQPRKFQSHPIRRNEYWLEAILPDSELERSPAVKKAWEQFQIIAGLSNVKLDKTYK